MPKTFARPFEPSERAVRSLIRRASQHPLGRDFLLLGALDAVAATFAVHAFVVDKARETLAGQGVDPEPALPDEEAPTPARARAKSA